MPLEQLQNVFSRQPASSAGATTPNYITRTGIVGFLSTGEFAVGFNRVTNGGVQRIDSVGSEPNYCQVNTTAAAGDIEGFNWTQQSFFGPTLSCLRMFNGRVLIPDIANTRIWFCWADTSNAGPPNAMKSDAPLNNLIGFRFSTAAGDVNWQCITQKVGTGNTVVDSGVAVVVNTGYSLQALYLGASVVFSINGTVVATITLTLPVTTTRMEMILTVDNVGLANAKSVAYNSVQLQHSLLFG